MTSFDDAYAFPCTVDDVVRRPVRESAPQGVSPQDDDRFEQLDAHLSGTAARDWPRVAKEAGELLLEVGKDTRVTAWFTEALFQVHGWAGLAVGFDAWGFVLGPAWDAWFPKAVVGRRGGVVRFVQRATQWVKLREDATITPAEAQAILDAASKFTAFESTMMARLGGDAPSADLLSDMLRRLVPGATKALAPPPKPAAPAPAPKPPAQPPAQQAPVPSPSASSPARAPAPSTAAAAPPPAELVAAPPGPGMDHLREGPSADAVATALSRERSRLRPLFEALPLVAPDEPWAWRLPREWYWGLQDPPSRAEDDPARTLARGPSSATRGELTARAAGAPEAFVGWLARAWLEAPLWLDPHRHAYQALGKLGRRRAADAVAEAVRALLKRVPALPSLRDEEGDPLADADTQAWCASLGGARATAAVAAPPPMLPPVATTTTDTNEALRAELAGGDPRSRVAEVRRLLEGSPAGRDRFLLRLAYAEGLLRVEPRLAAPLLLVLDREARSVSLDSWEPALAARLVTLLLVARATDPAFPTADADPLTARAVALNLLPPYVPPTME